MARSIGKVKLRKLKELTRKIMAEPLVDRWSYPSAEEISEQVPPEWFHIWEGAYYEIIDTIEDTRMKG